MHKLAALVLVAALPACGSDDPSVEFCFEPTVDLSVCDPAQAEFSLASTNPYYPLQTGLSVILEGMDGDELVRVERTVLADTEMVAGVETHVLEHNEYVDGELVEMARNFYVEATDGTVCYFGEDVDNYKGGKVANHHGAWRADDPDAAPGIIMPANPTPGQAYFQENSPDANDQGKVEGWLTETFAGTEYTDVLHITDGNPMEGCKDLEPKKYVAGIGEVADVDVVLKEYTPGS